jgi:hypothetical protein
VSFIQHPRIIARIAGVFYLAIIVCAVFAYMVARARLIVPADMARTAANLLANEQLYRAGFSAAVIVVVCNPPLGVLLNALLRIVNPLLARLALVFITISTTIEAINLLNYITPLLTFTLPEYSAAFTPDQLHALARGPIRLFGYTFSISLVFFGVFCGLIGWLIFRSGFLPRILGLLMMVSGVGYWVDSFGLFLRWPDVPYLLAINGFGEVTLALWLLIVGVNETKWQARAAEFRAFDLDSDRSRFS